MADKPVSNARIDVKAAAPPENEAPAAFSLIGDVYKPAANVEIETYNAIILARRTVSKGIAACSGFNRRI